MTYLYGDATPFPLEENFIETISAATDACVALFQLDVELSGRRDEARQVAAQCDGEISRLGALARSMETALAPHLAKADTVLASQSAAGRIAQQATEIIKQTRAEVLRTRDEGLRVTQDLNLGPRIIRALSVFVMSHELPRTSWFVRWRGGQESGEGNLIVSSYSPCHLELSFRAGIPAGSRWNGPVRVEDLAPELRLELQHKGGWLRSSGTSKKSIHRFHITQVETTAEHIWFELRQNPTKPSLGYEIVVQSSDQANPIIYPVDAKGDRAEPLTVTGVEADDLVNLWNTIAAELGVLVEHRHELLSARLRGNDVADLDEPAEMGEALLMSLAPIVREIRVRSRVPGELVLKRELGDGRREEVFIPRRELESKFEVLPYEYQACFNAVGLGGEATSDFLRREHQLSSTIASDNKRQGGPDLSRAHRIAKAKDPDASAA
jgi:hypothetical protein